MADPPAYHNPEAILPSFRLQLERFNGTGGPWGVDDLGAYYGAIAPEGGVNVDSFGAIGDGNTDDSAAFEAAAASLADGGGRVYMSPNKKYRLSNLTVIPNICFVGPYQFVGSPGDNTSAPYAEMGAVLLDSSGTIRLGSNSGFFSALIYRHGMTFPTADPSAFAGTCFTVTGDDCFVANSLVFGFAQALISDTHQRINLQNLGFDCTAGVDIHDAFDTCVLQNIHGFPYATIQAYTAAVSGGGTAAANQYRLIRSGRGIYLHGASDDTSLVNVLVYGYAADFYINSSALTMVNVWSDYPSAATRVGTIGFYFGPAHTQINASNVFAYSSDIPLVVDGASNSSLNISGLVIQGSQTYGIELRAGLVRIPWVFMTLIGTVPVNITADTVRCNIAGLVDNLGGTAMVNLAVANLTTANITINLVNNLAAGSNIFQTHVQIPTPLASAATLNLPTKATTEQSEYYNITGTTDITSILAPWTGRRIVLLFSGVLTVHDGGNLLLAGNLTTTANSTLELIGFGTNWAELGRSVN